ncbi:MAG: PKD domain-containing protein, partial [Chitinophagia bacterium]|nr:PKD domain-containing protein [Chitinophagia bacterium]
AGSYITLTNNNRDVSGTRILTPHIWNMNSGSSSSRDTNVNVISFIYRYGNPGTYTITLHDSDDAGCSSTSTATVRVVQPVVHFYSPDTAENLCTNIPITFHCTDTGYLYSWNFGDGGGYSTPSATAMDTTHTYLANGRYSVSCVITSRGTGGSSSFPVGCSSTLTRNNYINIRSFTYTSSNYGDGNIVTCPPLRIVRFADLPGGIPPDFTTYRWTVTSGMGVDTASGPLLNESLYTSGAVTVVLTGTTHLGCQDTEVTRYFIGGPSGYITVTPDSGCVPQNVHISFVDTGTTAASSRYVWYTCPFGAFTTVTPDTVLPYTLAGSYCPPIVTIQSGACAVNIRAADSIRIFPIPKVSVTPNPVATLCYGSSTILAATSDRPMSSYTWSPARGLTATTGSAISAGPLVNTTYTVTGVSINGCVDTAIVYVPVDSPLHMVISGKARVCLGICDTLVAHGVPGALYAWQGTGISCAVCDTNVICINRTRTFTVTATNSYGCQTTDSFKVTIDPLPILHVTPDPAYVCKYSTGTQLTATGAATYEWKPRIGLSCDNCANPTCNVGANIIYSITGTTQYGCVDSISIPVTVFDTTVTGIHKDTSICIGQSAQLFAKGGIKFLWHPGRTLNDSTIERPIATPTVTTTYTAFITENVCFADTLSVKVTVVPIPKLRVPAGVEVIAGSQVQLYVDTLNSVKLTHFLWTPSDTTLTCYTCPRPIATPINTTVYQVVASTDEGCADSATVTIRVLCNEDQVFIPNTFTPNGDGLNDRFYVSGRGLGSIKRMAVYNRWGELMFESNYVRSNDAGTGWDGSYKGEPLPPDVYVYIIDVLCSTGEQFSFKGDISLVR